jgi:hypothetical protein
LQQAEAEWQAQQQQEQVAQQQFANQLTYHELRGRCMERAEQLKQTNPALHQKITNNLTMLEGILDPEQRKALEHALVAQTSAVWRLNRMGRI